MKGFKDFIIENALDNIPHKKNKWTLIPSKADKENLSKRFIKLVQSAYSKTNEGSFVNTLDDVFRSEWIGVNLPGETEISAVIFYRGPRSDEKWKGKKVQGIGHVGSIASKKAVMEEQRRLLLRNGWWVESSDAVEHILYKMKMPYVTDESILNKIFPGTDLEMTGYKGQYRRKLSPGSSKWITETIFGNPVV